MFFYIFFSLNILKHLRSPWGVLFPNPPSFLVLFHLCILHGMRCYMLTISALINSIQRYSLEDCRWLKVDLYSGSCAQKQQAEVKGLMFADLFSITDLPCLIPHCLWVGVAILIEEQDPLITGALMTVWLITKKQQNR